jgi:hypothetical protein
MGTDDVQLKSEMRLMVLIVIAVTAVNAFS